MIVIFARRTVKNNISLSSGIKTPGLLVDGGQLPVRRTVNKTFSLLEHGG
jgi:hypothetical protein